MLSTVDVLKYLGVNISTNLSWSYHVGKICETAKKKLWFLRRKLRLASQSVKLTAYLTYVRPTLEYAGIIWDPHQSGLIQRLERVQRRAARFILARYSRKDSVTEMLSLLNLPTLAERRRIARLKFFYLLTKNKFNINSSQYLIARQGRALRKSKDGTFEIPQMHINSYAFSFFPRTIKEWNQLPLITRESISADHFENNLAGQ